MEGVGGNHTLFATITVSAKLQCRSNITGRKNLCQLSLICLMNGCKYAIWTVSVSYVYTTVLCLDSYRGSSSVRQPNFGISDMLVQANSSGACSLGIVSPHDPYPTPKSRMLRSQFPPPVPVVLSLYLSYILCIPVRQYTNACTSFKASVTCTSDMLQYQPRLFYPLQVPGEGVQRSSHQQRVQDTPCQLIQLPGQQADRKDESWKAKKEEKKQEGQRERREEGEGECPTV